MADANTSKGNKGDKRKHNQSHDGEEGDTNEPHRAIIALHPADAAVAVVVGNELRVYDKRDSKVHTLINSETPDSSVITRCIAFSRCGRFFASGGDDKMAVLWSCDGWKVIKSMRSPKKISVVEFSADGTTFMAGNKFGDVLVATTVPGSETAATAACNSNGKKTPDFELMMGHYCSILTSLTVSSDGKLLATTDRDCKVRVSVLPDDPMQGAHEIQSYCFGHTNFASCSAFIPRASNDNGDVLITGGGDGTVRMWDPLEGKELCLVNICEGETEAATTEGAGGAASEPRPVLALQPSEDGRHVIVVMDGDAAIRVLSVDTENGTTSVCATCTLPSLPVVTDVTMDSTGTFWLVGGPIGKEGTAALLTCAVLTADGQLEVVDPQPLPAEAKSQLEKYSVDPSEVKPTRHLPSYLNRKPFILEERALKHKKVAESAVEEEQVAS